MKLPREHIVSLRLSEKEAAALRRRADEAGITLSALIRDLIREQLAPPLPRGESAGFVPQLVQCDDGVLRGPGVWWYDGTVGHSVICRAAA